MLFIGKKKPNTETGSKLDEVVGGTGLSLQCLPGSVEGP